MVNSNTLMMVLCISLLPLPSLCDGEGNDYSSESLSWETVWTVYVRGEDSLQYQVGCDANHLLAPGFSVCFRRHQLSSTGTLLREFYLDCIGKIDCNISKKFITHVRSFTPISDVPNIHQFSKDIIICLPDDHFARPNSFEQVVIQKDRPDYGFILQDQKEQSNQDIKIIIHVEEGQRLFVKFFYTESYSSSVGPTVTMRLSGGLEKHCTYIVNPTSKLQVEVKPENRKVVVFFPWCSNIGKFAIGYIRYFYGDTQHDMPSDWNFTGDNYTPLNPRTLCISKCPQTPPHPVTMPLDDTSTTEAIILDRGASAAVIGVSVVAGLLLAAMLVVAAIFLLWKRNMLRLPVKSTMNRQAAPAPTKQKDGNPSDGYYSQPYDNVRTPDILNDRSGSNGNLYAEVNKDRSRPPLVTGSSLHIEENDLYPRPGVGIPRRGPRESASVDIVENDGYDSFGTT